MRVSLSSPNLPERVPSFCLINNLPPRSPHAFVIERTITGVRRFGVTLMAVEPRAERRPLSPRTLSRHFDRRAAVGRVAANQRFSPTVAEKSRRALAGEAGGGLRERSVRRWDAPANSRSRNPTCAAGALHCRDFSASLCAHEPIPLCARTPVEMTGKIVRRENPLCDRKLSYRNDRVERRGGGRSINDKSGVWLTNYVAVTLAI